MRNLDLALVFILLFLFDFFMICFRLQISEKILEMGSLVRMVGREEGRWEQEFRVIMRVLEEEAWEVGRNLGRLGGTLSGWRNHLRL